MSDVETQLVAALLADIGITNLVSDRIYHIMLPDDVTYPALSYNVIYEQPLASGNCRQARIQCTPWAESFPGVKGVKNALIAFSNGQPNASYLVGPDLYDEESQLYHQPVDLILFLRGD